jgi:hypothetical protein
MDAVGCEVKVRTFAFVMLVLIGPAWGQTDSKKPYSREAAEKSFQTLVAGKDKDIIDVINGDGLVCFADSLPLYKEDRLLIIVLSKPSSWIQDTTNTDPNERATDYPVISSALLRFDECENQHWTPVVQSGVLAGNWHSYGHYERLKHGKVEWKPYGDSPPVFRYPTDKDAITGATDVTATEDGSTFYVSKKYRNRSGGTTMYEMNVRLSTGRYKETWTPDKGEPFESFGNCYRAKEFVRLTAVKNAK